MPKEVSACASQQRSNMPQHSALLLLVMPQKPTITDVAASDALLHCMVTHYHGAIMPSWLAANLSGMVAAKTSEDAVCNKYKSSADVDGSLLAKCPVPGWKQQNKPCYMLLHVLLSSRP
jgi:hypothetical protein